MHGRLKVKTSEEQAEAKRLEREQKLKLYQSATQTVFQKRQAGELDESVLELTSQILGANPDFATLWNCRREVLQQLEAQKSPEELAALVKTELGFLESCLRVNPKSYGTWHHRSWLLGRLPEPNWARELELCARFLEVDERNFHCWDYRRFVAAQAPVPPAEELAFTDSLITRNFSNYSSWHYRSCLLPQLHPQPDSGPQGRLPEDVLLKELELVQNAFFTDPNDQSAWFYHRWLLGRADPQDALRCLHVSRDEACLTVSFSRPVLVGSGTETLLLIVDKSPLAVEWRTPDGRTRPSHVWLCDLPAASLNDQLPQHTFRVIWTAGDAQKECVLLKGDIASISTPCGSTFILALLSQRSPSTTRSCSQAARRAGAGTRPRMSSSSGVSCRWRSPRCSSLNLNPVRSCRSWSRRISGACSPSSC